MSVIIYTLHEYSKCSICFFIDTHYIMCFFVGCHFSSVIFQKFFLAFNFITAVLCLNQNYVLCRTSSQRSSHGYCWSRRKIAALSSAGPCFTVSEDPVCCTRSPSGTFFSPDVALDIVWLQSCRIMRESHALVWLSSAAVLGKRSLGLWLADGSCCWL